MSSRAEPCLVLVVVKAPRFSIAPHYVLIHNLEAITGNFWNPNRVDSASPREFLRILFKCSVYGVSKCFMFLDVTVNSVMNLQRPLSPIIQRR